MFIKMLLAFLIAFAAAPAHAQGRWRANRQAIPGKSKL
jgi:hypothetical protein